MGLSLKQERFIDEYLICLNGSEAVRRAKYKGKANVTAARLLANVSIKEEIKRRLEEKHLTKEMALARLAEMATSNISDFAHIRNHNDLANAREQGYLIKRFRRKVTITPSGAEYEDIEIELYDARKALELVSKHLSIFNDRVEHTGIDGQPIEFVLVEKPE